MSLVQLIKASQELLSLDFSLGNEFTFIICNETSDAPPDMTVKIPKELILERNNGIYSIVLQMQMYPFLLVSGRNTGDMYELAILITKLLGYQYCSIIKPGTKIEDVRDRGDVYSSIQENKGDPILTLRKLISSLIGCINWDTDQILLVGIDKEPQEKPTSICSGRFTKDISSPIIVYIPALENNLDPRRLYGEKKSFGINSINGHL